MRGIQWIFDATPSAEARSRAIRHANFLIGIMKKTKGKVMQQIWTDGTYFYHYKTSPFINQIRVWGEDKGTLRFWILADDNTLGAPAGTQAFYVLYIDKLGVWQAAIVDEEFRLTYPGEYHWNNTDGSIIINRLYARDEVAQSCFAWNWNNFVPSYCRFGGFSRYSYYDAGTGLTSYPTSIEPLISDAITHVNRETRAVPTRVPTGWGYQLADLPIPYPNINLIAPERSTHDMPTHATNPNDFWNTSAGVTAVTTVNSKGGRYDFEWLYNYEGAIKYMRDINTVTEQALIENIDLGALGLPYLGVGTFYPVTHVPAFSWPSYISLTNQHVYFVAASSGGLKAILAIRGAHDVTEVETTTGLFVELTIDHAAQTVTLAEKKSEYSQNDDSVTVITVNDGAGGNFNGSKTSTIVQHIYGYGYDELGVLKEVEIRKTTVNEEVIVHTFTEVQVPDPPNAPPEAGDYFETIRTWDDSRNIDYLVEVLIDSVVLVTKAFTPTVITAVGSQTIRNTSDGAGGTTETIIDVNLESRTEADAPEVILHSLETLTDSLSVSIIEGTNIYDAANTSSDRTVTDTETTRIRNSLIDTKIYTATSIGVVGPGVIPIESGTGHQFWAAGITSSVRNYEIISPTQDFPRAKQNVRNHSTGSLRRFLRDFEGNMLTYCPTGQEAYWNTSKVNKLGTHDETTPPIKWRLDGMPHIFGLYDNVGALVDLTHLSLANVEAIGVIDGFNTWSE